jgi:hypothetical protein
MPFPCDKCKRAGAICSGLEGERCGRCRAIRKPCSHNTLPGPSVSKFDPPGANFVSPLSVSSVAKGHVSLHAKEDEGETPSRRPADGQISSDKITLKLKLGSVLGNSNATNGMSSILCAHSQTADTDWSGAQVAPPLKSSIAHNASPAESQDEDDNAVEELMYPDCNEEDIGGVGTVAKIAQGDAAALGTANTRQSTAAFISQAAVPRRTSTLRDDNTADCSHDNAHADTSFEFMAEATGITNCTNAPTMTIKSICCRGLSNVPLLQSAEDHERSNSLSNDCATGPSNGLCHFGPPKRWNPASHTMIHDFQESPHSNSRTIVNGPLSDPTDAPALDCSQEVCTRAADGAAVGGGSSRSTQAPVAGVSPHMDLRVGCAPSAATTPFVSPREPTTTCPLQVADEGSAPTDRMSVDEEIVRFMEITLTGMAQVQDGLRGVFAIQKRRRAVQKRKIVVAGDK